MLNKDNALDIKIFDKKLSQELTIIKENIIIKYLLDNNWFSLKKSKLQQRFLIFYIIFKILFSQLRIIDIATL